MCAGLLDQVTNCTISRLWATVDPPYPPCRHFNSMIFLKRNLFATIIQLSANEKAATRHFFNSLKNVTMKLVIISLYKLLWIIYGDNAVMYEAKVLVTSVFYVQMYSKI